MTIYFQQGNHYYLSNFYEAKFIYKDILWPSVEHAYQAMKSDSKSVWEYVAKLKSPNEAKKFGRRVCLRRNWEDIKLSIMISCVRAKFTQNKNLKEMLVATGDQILVEYTWWGDTYWGVNTNYEGENHLGIILMEIRNEISS